MNRDSYIYDSEIALTCTCCNTHRRQMPKRKMEGATIGCDGLQQSICFPFSIQVRDQAFVVHKSVNRNGVDVSCAEIAAHTSQKTKQLENVCRLLVTVEEDCPLFFFLFILSSIHSETKVQSYVSCRLFFRMSAFLVASIDRTNDWQVIFPY